MEKPKLSVVIASVNGLPYIEECLDSLERQSTQVKAEVIVADCCSHETRTVIEHKFPQVKLLKFPRRLTIPELRAIGIAHSTGEIVVITEDHCIADANWYTEILKAHESEHVVIGGAVENASVKRIVDWAVYLCEYSRYMNPIPSGIVGDIPGNNASYKRRAFDNIQELLDRGFWETFLYWKLKNDGIALCSVPSIIVYHKKSFGVFEFLSQRYHYGRSFAGMRIADASPSKRVFFVICAPLLPGVLISRIARRIFQKKRHRKEFFLSLPLLSLFMLSWSFGEFCGYLLGPGNSLIKIE